jgi:dihydroorotase
MRPNVQPPIILKQARIIDPSRGLDEVGTVVVDGGVVRAAGAQALNQGHPDGAWVIDCSGLVVAPGLVDMRVFVGEPGREHRETLSSAGQAAAAGGITTIVTMPDGDPVIDDVSLVDFMQRRGRDTSAVHVHPMAAMTKGLKGREMTEIGLLREAGAVAFTDGRNSVTNAQVMRRILTYARDFDALIVHHVEDPDLVGSGVMNEGETASRLGLLGIPVEAESVMLDRDLRLAALSRSRYHAAQLSCAQSIEALRRAKDAGLNVSCGASINNLTLNENDIGPYRTFFKMSPPLRTEADRQAIVDAVADGTIDVIVSSHDPQDVETKRHPFAEAADGAIGLETLLAAGLRLVHDGTLSLMDLIAATSSRPAALLGLDGGTLAPGAIADILVFAPDKTWQVREDAIRSRSKNTPFEGTRFDGCVVRTLVAGQLIYDYASI